METDLNSKSASLVNRKRLIADICTDNRMSKFGPRNNRELDSKLVEIVSELPNDSLNRLRDILKGS